MFTQRSLQLSQFDGQFNLRLVRDCEFSFVGKVPTLLDRRVVPCAKSSHLDEAIAANGVAGIITVPDLINLVPAHLGVAASSTPQASAYELHETLCDLPDFHWTDFATRVDPAAQIFPGAYVAQKNVVIGPRSLVMPGAIICERTVIGADCSIGPGAVVGCDAFEVNQTRSPQKILRQAGGVRLADHVEIQAKCTIVRATFGGFTEMGAETKLDCQVHLAHDCVVGQRVRIAACAEISGRVVIGDDVFIGPNSSVSNGLTIGDGATITIGAVVVRDVEPRERVTGHFALPHRKWLSFIRSIR